MPPNTNRKYEKLRQTKRGTKVVTLCLDSHQLLRYFCVTRASVEGGLYLVAQPVGSERLTEKGRHGASLRSDKFNGIGAY